MLFENVERIYENYKTLDKKIDKATLLLSHKIIKSFRTYCVEKGYSPQNTPDFTFYPKYQDWVSSSTIKSAYEVYVDGKLKDIDKDLKSIFK